MKAGARPGERGWRALRGLGRAARAPRAPEGLHGPAVPPPAASGGDAAASPASDGAVWVQDGRLHVRNPSGLGRWPSVHLPADSPLALLVNGEERRGEVVLRAEDRVELRAEARTEPATVEVRLSADGLEAWVVVQPPTRVVPAVRDGGPGVRLELEADTRREALPLDVGPGAVEEALAAAGVTAAPMADAVAEALGRPGVWTRVARGRPPQAGRSAQVWSRELGMRSAPPASEHPARADDLPEPPATRPRPRVAAGEPLVHVFQPGAPGLAGESVTGASLPPQPAWCPVLVPGPGAMASADGATLIAARSGHPVVELGPDRVYATVAPEVEVPGHVDAAVGDLDVDGDVWVAGNVESGRTVRATGHVEVGGRVAQARIEAGGGVCVHGGVANASLSAGMPGLVYARAAALCAALLRELEGDAGGALGAAGAGRRAGAVARRLHAELGHAQGWLHPEVARLFAALPGAAGEPAAGGERSDPAGLAALARVALERMREVLERRAPCRARHLDHARVEATGDVEVAVPGVRQSRVVTLGQARIRGALRGGQLWALQGAELDVVGGDDVGRTLVEVGPRGALRAAEVRPGAEFVRGTEVRRFDAVARDVLWPADGPDGGGAEAWPPPVPEGP